MTAETEAGIPAAPSYLPLGVARSTPTDTQDCLRTGPGPDCPVDITQGLGLTGRHEPFLELEVQLQGPGAPVLEDFRVSYSCIIDQ